MNISARLEAVAVPELMLTDPVHDRTRLSLFCSFVLDIVFSNEQLGDLRHKVVFSLQLCITNKLKLSEGIQVG